MSDRTYFLVEPGSPVLGVIDAAIAKQQAYYKAAGAFAEAFGTMRWYATQNFYVHMLGLAFEKELPLGWRLNKKKGYSTPDRTTLGKAIAARMRELPGGVAAATFSQMLDDAFKGESKLSYATWEGCGLSWTVYEKFGDRFLLSVPTACKVSPPGCRELKMSEYWKLREEAGAEA